MDEARPPSSSPTGYCEVRRWTEALAAPLSAEDQTAQSMPDVSPTKWHRAHTSWFFEEFVLQPFVPGDAVYHPDFRYLFNSYYEAVGPRHPRPDRGVVTRPGADEVGAYRRAVDARMVDLLDASPPADVAALVELGLHHEQQHQELVLMDIKHVLSRNALEPVYCPRAGVVGCAAPPAADWVAHDGGAVQVGAGPTGFAFDNERPFHQVLLRPYALRTTPVTNGEWAAFVDDGGYQRPDLWLSDGWHAVQDQAWEAPLYWSRAAAGWQQYTLHGVEPLAEAEPVCHVSYYEADAFARWSGARLPTEAEWEAAAVACAGGSFEVSRRVDSVAEACHPHVVTPRSGALAGIGAVWEWTASAYLPYPGFAPAPGAVGEYNGKFMVGQHVLRGGSCATPAGHTRPTYRNFFPPAARWPFTGLRLARDD